MKNKIITLIIGILIGAVVTAGVFLLINNNKANSFGKDMKGRPSEMRDGNSGEKGNMVPSENSNGKGGKNRTKEKSENTTQNNISEPQETTNVNTTV